MVDDELEFYQHESSMKRKGKRKGLREKGEREKRGQKSEPKGRPFEEMAILYIYIIYIHQIGVYH